MRIKHCGAAWMVAVAMAALAHPHMGRAQDSTRARSTPGRPGIAATIGAYGYTREPDSLAAGKFEEYRDMRTAGSSSARPLLEQLQLNYTPTDSFAVYQLNARRLLDRDQSLYLQAKQPGRYDFQVRSDRIPHTFSTTARSPGIENNLGYNSLPFPRPDSTAWRNSPYLGAVRSQWDPTKASLVLTPNRDNDFKVEYTHIDKSGGRPGSMTFNATTGPTREFVEPIDQSINDVAISHSFTTGERSPTSFIRSFQLLGSYDYSRFANSVTSTMVDNTQLGVSSPTLGAASSRLSLAPSNSAHTGVLTSVIGMPWRTRLSGTASLSIMRQNDLFVPQTSNDSLAKNANYGLVSPLPRASLDGHARTWMANVSATSQPIDKLTLGARYRNFDYSNQTEPFHVRAMVISDRTITLADSLTSELHPFSKRNQEVSASYRLPGDLALTGAYAWEQWHRDTDVRPVGRTNERMPRVSIDYDGLEFLSVRGSFSSGTRRGDAYTPLDAVETVGFRPFDLADRDRKRTSVMVTVTPIANLSLGLEREIGDDAYPHSTYGTQSDKSAMTGVDLDWSVANRFSIGAGYSIEHYNNELQLRYKTGADTARSPTYNNPTYVWYNHNTDKNATSYATFTAVVIPDKLDVGGSYSLADSHFWVSNGNPTQPKGGTVAQDSAATTIDFPEVSQRMEPLMLFVRHQASTDWAFTVRFQKEIYRQSDFRTIAPSYSPLTGNLPGALGQVAGTNTGQYHFLGAGYLPYNAAWITLLVSYHPAMMPFARGRSTF